MKKFRLEIYGTNPVAPVRSFVFELSDTSTNRDAHNVGDLLAYVLAGDKTITRMVLLQATHDGYALLNTYYSDTEQSHDELSAVTLPSTHLKR